MRAMPSPRRPDPVFRTRTPKEAFAAMAAEVREGLVAPPAARAALQVLLRRARQRALRARSRGCPSTTRPARRPRSSRPTRRESSTRSARASSPSSARAPGTRSASSSTRCARAAGSRASSSSRSTRPTCATRSARLQADYPEARVRGHRRRLRARPPAARARAAGGCCSSSPGPSATCTRTTCRPSSAPRPPSLAPGDGFLVGVDLVKDPARLHAAYNDSAGVTAEFNLNILRVLNDRLGADFDPSDFEHRAFYDAERQWIEMRLRARRPVSARVPGGGRHARPSPRARRSAPSCRASTRASRSRRASPAPASSSSAGSPTPSASSRRPS